MNEKRVSKAVFMNKFDEVIADVEKNKDVVYIICDDEACKKPSLVLLPFNLYERMLKA